MRCRYGRCDRRSCIYRVAARTAFVLLLVSLPNIGEAQSPLSLATPINHENDAACGTRPSSWYKDPISDMKGWSALRIKRQTEVESLDDCALLCTGGRVGMKHAGEEAEKEERTGPWLACYSFTYAAEDQICQLFLSDKVDETTTLIGSPGSMHYIRIFSCWNGYIGSVAERCQSAMLHWFSPPLVGRKGPSKRRIARWIETPFDDPLDCALRCILHSPTCYSFTASTKDNTCMLYSKAPEGEEDSDLVPAYSNMVHYIRDIGCWEQVNDLQLSIPTTPTTTTAGCTATEAMGKFLPGIPKRKGKTDRRIGRIVDPAMAEPAGCAELCLAHADPPCYAFTASPSTTL